MGLQDLAGHARRITAMMAESAHWPAARRIEALRTLAAGTPALGRPIMELLLKELPSTVYSREPAAAALRELGAAPAARAYALLAALFADRDRDRATDLDIGLGDRDGGFQQLFTAKAIGALGAEYHQRAAEALESVITRYDNYIGQQAAQALGALGGQYRPAAAAALWEMIRGTRHATDHVRLMAATSFIAWGRDYRSDAVAALRGLATDSGPVRVEAAVALARVDDEHRQEATALLFEMVRDRGYFQAGHLGSAARALLDLDSALRPQLAQALRTHLAERIDNTFRAAALTMSDLGSPYQPEAVRALVRVLADPATPQCDRVESALALSALSSEHRGAALDAIIAVILDPIGEDWTISWACEELTILGTAALSEGTRRLGVVADDPAEPKQRRDHAIQALAELAEST